MNAVEIAIRMETDAIAFYTEASAKIDNKIGKMMFRSIVEDEKRHLELLKGILNDLEMSIKDVHPIKNVRTIFQELKHEMMERVGATDDELNAFKIASEMEKKGIEFYMKAASEAPEPKEKALFERLIKEEEQHYSIFSNTYFFMHDTGNWFMWDEQSLVDGGTPWA
ncbi:MAG: ferritin family protein [Nitrospirota bacterium]